ncbi:MAG: oligosaccharide flippase family protein [Candidatus Parcubacteria bacterium]|nr:oligosaccharide flippase family protein [Candidatus Parcubacteria bacterium]
MVKRIRHLGNYFLKNELVSGSIYIFLGSVVANVFNLFFSLFMSRNLTVEGFGILASTFSLIGLMAIPAGSIIPTIVNFAGPHFVKDDYGSVRALFLKIIKPLLYIGIFMFFSFFVFAGYMGDFFKIADRSIVVIIGLSVALAYIGAVSTGLLQAKLAFKYISFLNLIGSLVKFALGAGLVFLGLGVRGAVWGVFIAGLAPSILGFIYLKSVFTSKIHKASKIHFKSILSYGAPSSLAMLGMTSLISTDILLVKHFFDPLQAGIYAGLSLVGKVIFFFTGSIAGVMFPLIVKKHAKNENYNNVFKMAIALVFIPSVFISTFYFLYPDLVINFFIKNEIYRSASGLLGLFGVFITIYSLITLFVYYFLSIKKTNVYIPVLLAAISQLLLIVFYHGSLFAVVVISLLVSLVLLSTLVIYYIRIYGEYKKINNIAGILNI